MTPGTATLSGSTGGAAEPRRARSSRCSSCWRWLSSSPCPTGPATKPSQQERHAYDVTLLTRSIEASISRSEAALGRFALDEESAHQRHHLFRPVEPRRPADPPAQAVRRRGRSAAPAGRGLEPPLHRARRANSPTSPGSSAGGSGDYGIRLLLRGDPLAERAGAAFQAARDRRQRAGVAAAADGADPGFLRARRPADQLSELARHRGRGRGDFPGAGRDPGDPPIRLRPAPGGE